MNYLLIILDATPYFVFQLADAKNIKSLGKVEKITAPAIWTLPSLTSMLYIPYYHATPYFNIKDLPEPVWLPSFLQRKGYKTVFIGDNPWFSLGRQILNRGFDHYHALPLNPRAVARKTLEYLEGKFFVLSFFTSTHYPYREVPSRRKRRFEGDLGRHIEAVEYVDSLVGEILRKVSRETEVVVTSDHGDVYRGNKNLGHNPKHLKEYTESLFKVFLVRGVV